MKILLFLTITVLVTIQAANEWYQQLTEKEFKSVYDITDKELGSGVFGVVKEGVMKSSRKTVAIKMAQLSPRKEIDVLIDLKNAYHNLLEHNIPDILFESNIGHQPVFVMSALGKRLDDLINQNVDIDMKILGRNMITAVKALHSSGYVYNYLNWEEKIFIGAEENPQAGETSNKQFYLQDFTKSVKRRDEKWTPESGESRIEDIFLFAVALGDVCKLNIYSAQANLQSIMAACDKKNVPEDRKAILKCVFGYLDEVMPEKRAEQYKVEPDYNRFSNCFK